MLFKPDLIEKILTASPTRRTYPSLGESPLAPEYLYRRLLNGTKLNEETGCWEWQRHINNKGYGRLTVGGRGKYAHRLIYELVNGSIPDGLLVCHRCDNPKCINPEHLFLGTQSENMKDCFSKGRISNPTTRLYGESNPGSKLTKNDVIKIRHKVEAGEARKEIAVAFGISESQVSNIYNGKHWKIEEV